jgi:serine/threonine protein kinase
VLGGPSQPDDEEDAGLPKPGDLFGGRFLIEGLVGRGGMGAVFAARHEMLGTRVAIKILLSEVASNKEAVARFLNEARAASRIEGGHVARVMDVATLGVFASLTLLYAAVSGSRHSARYCGVPESCDAGSHDEPL